MHKEANLRVLPQLKTRLEDDLCSVLRLRLQQNHRREGIDRRHPVDCLVGGLAGVVVGQDCPVVVFPRPVARSKVEQTSNYG